MSYKVSSLKSGVQIQRGTDADISLELEKTIEILVAQIESLDLELCQKNQELEEMKQELRYTNQKLCTPINSKQLTLAQAEELATNLLANEKPIEGCFS